MMLIIQWSDWLCFNRVPYVHCANQLDEKLVIHLFLVPAVSTLTLNPVWMYVVCRYVQVCVCVCR